MSLRVKNVRYEDVNLATYHDVDVFAEELRVLIASGYAITLETIASCILYPESVSFKLNPANKKKFEFDHPPPTYHINNSTKSDSTM